MHVKQSAPRWIFTIVLVFPLAMGLWRCQGDSQGHAGKSIDFKRAASEGRRLYQQHCIQCHQADGKGLGKVYPPLAGADYLLRDPGRAACIIRYGMKGKIFVNERDYNLAMLGYKDFRKEQIAQLLTYIGNTWGNKMGYIGPDSVRQFLQTCDGPVRGESDIEQ